MQPIEYMANFQLSIKQPEHVSLDPIDFCPGYQTSTMLKTIGIKELLPDSVKWYFSTDSRNWRDVVTNVNQFELSTDGLALTMKDLKISTIIKVAVKGYTGILEAKQKVNFLSRFS